MTIALKIGDDTSSVRGLLYLDVVTSFAETRSGSVTSFPLDTGVSVADHYIAKNATYQLRGILSSADISGVSSGVNIDGNVPMNSHTQPSTPAILDFAVGTARLLPGSANEYYKSTIPEVFTGGDVATSQDQVKDVLRQLMYGIQYSTTLKRYQNKMTIITLYEMDGSNIKSKHDNLVLTSFSIDEDENTGDCIPLNMSFEQVRFVSVEKVVASSSEATKKTSNKGVKKPTTKVVTETYNPATDPKILGNKSFNDFVLKPFILQED